MPRLSPSQKAEVDAEILASMPNLLRKEGYRMVIRVAGTGTYWKHRDGRMVLLTRDKRGEVVLERLDS